MRFDELGLLAFGPFSSLRLDLSRGAPGGLVVIYGPNEAGKSTALRAVSALLYGIDERTSDAHLHSTNELCVSARLSEAEGEKLEIRRRKRRTDSLRTSSDQPLDERALLPFLHGVDKGTFQSLFALDHQRLKEGGQALLEGKGDVGESLFDAGVGGPGVHRVLSELRRQAQELFRRRAKVPKLNAAILRYKEARDETRQAVRSPGKYLEQQRQLELVGESLRRLKDERRELHTERAKLERTQRSLKWLARYAQIAEQKAALGAIPRLPEGSAESRRELSLVLQREGAEVVRLREHIARLQKRRATLGTHDELKILDDEALSTLSDQLGAHKKAIADLPKRRAELVRARTALGLALARTGRNEGRMLEGREATGRNSTGAACADELEVESGALLRARSLLVAWAELERDRSEHERHKIDLENELFDVQSELEHIPEIPNLKTLSMALASARAESAAPARWLELWEEAGALVELLRARGAALGLQAELVADRDRLSALVVPSVVELEQAEETRYSAEQALNAASGALAELELRKADAEHRFGAVQGAGPVPTEEELFDARRERDAAWQRFRRGDSSFEPALFERLLERADGLSDRLRREGQRLSEIRALKLEIERAGVEVRLKRAEVEEHAARFSHAKIAWAALWEPRGIAAKPAKVMREWLHGFGELKEHAGRLQEVRQRMEHERARCERLRAELDAVLLSLGQTPLLLDLSPRNAAGALEMRVSQVEHWYDELRVQSEQRRSLLVTAERLERRLGIAKAAWQRTEAAVAAGEQAAVQALAPLGLQGALSPERARTLVSELEVAARELDQVMQLRQRIDAIEQEAEQFRARVRGLVEEHAPDLEAEVVERAAAQLLDRSRRARALADQRRALDQDLEESRERLVTAQAAVEEAEARFAELLRAAGVKSDLELEAAETRVVQAAALGQEERAVVEQLLSVGQGLSIEALMSAAKGADHATLQARLEEIEDRLQEIETEQAQENKADGGLRKGLDYYEDESASVAHQLQQERLAQVRSLAERYAKLRLSVLILEREIRVYRERHQGPILSRARELFPQLTLGEFVDLKVGLEERTLLCVRRGGREVEVAGLSEGTQYQLYLALRVASLERALQMGQPLPVVLDDALIHFDDARAAAALAVFGELARKTQVLYFTHLHRDLALVERAVPADRLTMIQLAGAELAGARPELRLAQ